MLMNRTSRHFGGTLPSPRTPPGYGPGPHPAPWPPCATSRSARYAWPGSPTSLPGSDISAVTPPGPSPCSVSNAHEPDITTLRRDPGLRLEVLLGRYWRNSQILWIAG